MCDESPQERQDNEIEALKAIFGDEIVDNRPNIAWKVWRPLDLFLTLHPLHSSSVAGVHCSVTLHIKCCNLYPDKPPSISIHKLHGISNDNGSILLAELEDMAKNLCGEVMIFELAQHVQNFLHAHNKPTKSFYEEMVEQRNKEEMLKQHDIQEKENVERQKIKDEIQRRQEILKGAGRQKLHRSSISQHSDDNDSQGDVPQLVYYADNRHTPSKKSSKQRIRDVPCTCTAKGIQVLRLTQKYNKKIHLGKCVGHSPNGSTSYLAIDSDSGDFLITKKWIISPATDYQLRNKQMTLIKQDLKNILRLKHHSIIPYTVIECQQEIMKKNTYQCVYLMRDFIFGCSLKYLRTKFSLGDQSEALRVLRHVGVGVLSALKELHSVDIVHRDLRSENVYLDDSGAVKLVGVALDVRLSDIVELENYCERQTKTHDIFAAAQLLLSIVGGDDHIINTEIPSHLPSSAKDFFSRCLTEDENLQWSAEQLLNHGFLQNAPTHQPGSKQKDDGYSGSEDEDKLLAKSFVHNCLPANGHSRLTAEFEVLKWLGKGAFGDVLKVKNKLDGGFYAIKRIKLNPENVQLNKKITREVKLLSRLNHENVVRYYNAWIETMTSVLEDGEESADISVSKEKSPSKQKRTNSMEEAVAKLAPGVTLEWSISDAQAPKRDDSESEEEDEEEDDEDDGWLNMLPVATALDETSSSIEFEVDNDNQSQTLPSEDTQEPRPPTEHIKQVLYIQMEFCEKNTLRHAIDNGLYLETFRAWKLFREIVEGLAHVHQRGMIHRDLKPVNIFLDVNDHVKIGDFGLATKAFTGFPGVEDRSKPLEEFGGSLTGQIGTALYVAPELLQAANKVIYNQKVDIYSLGIILFEIFHPPLNTGMERMKVLTDLRSKDILMPKSFETEENAKKIHVIRWLLNHDAGLRPTCCELLSSEHVPRPVGEGALAGLLAHTLGSRASRGYSRLVAACLDQSMSAAEDYTYHSGLKTRPDLTLTQIKETVIKVFKSHGATEFSPPLLLPRAKCWDKYPNAVKLMTSFGFVCHLPHDLRLPFARHVAYTETKCMRRYIVDKVFREKHVEGFHPRELIECAFDIVTPNTGSLWSDAELLVVANKAAAEVNLKVSITLNHTEMLKILLLCCGVPIDRHRDMYPVLMDVRLGRITNLQLQTHLTSLCISNRGVSNLLRLMEAEVSIGELRETVQPLAKKNEWNAAINRAIADIDAVTKNAKALGVDCQMTVAPCLAYNATQHCGVFWQMSIERQAGGKHRSGDLIAAGGRYDALVEEFWKIARTAKEQADTLTSCSVGFSMSLERMAAIVKKRSMSLTACKVESMKIICVCLWSGEGNNGLRAAKLARNLRAAGYMVTTFYTASATEAHEQTDASLVLLEQDDLVCAVCFDENRVREHKMPYIEVLDFVKQKFNPDSVRSPEGNAARPSNWSESDRNGPNISVTIVTSEKITKATKRLYESQILQQAHTPLTALCGGGGGGGRARLVSVPLMTEAGCVRALAAQLDVPLRADQLGPAVRAVCVTYPRRRKVLEEAMAALKSVLSIQNSTQRSPEEPIIYALYSIPDSLCKLIM